MQKRHGRCVSIYTDGDIACLAYELQIRESAGKQVYMTCNFVTKEPSLIVIYQGDSSLRDYHVSGSEARYFRQQMLR